jgi:hypothetical protein
VSLIRWEKGTTHFKHDVVVPKALEKAKRTKDRLDIDAEENKAVKARSKGQCEVVWFGKKAKRVKRCERRAAPGVHHMYGGSGVRARGKSLLAKHKQDVCQECHDLITSKVLRRIGTEERLWTDEYEHQGK